MMNHKRSTAVGWEHPLLGPMTSKVGRRVGKRKNYFGRATTREGLAKCGRSEKQMTTTTTTITTINILFHVLDLHFQIN